MFALLSQALFPVQATAGTRQGDYRVFLCMDSPGATPTVDVAAEKLITSHETSKRYQGLKCADCVLASITAVASPEQVAIPVSYLLTVVTLAIDRARQPVGARAPPRPFSCGPPSEI
ncbi:hypothetical protein AEAC466_18040 [Asticcacaulis sp. AC466]|uniref:hypothetical protein n=1 Tax=Asticcacaulis sp. AC466 TaxID=1282362 RepID=UPI0003C3B344|nr:hypothetical protein [Asticcacaulis sp. AC466]ESQ82247.1 hypothetical protein AEAC466_18040 [Asticcacaulis sp. AC466]